MSSALPLGNVSERLDQSPQLGGAIWARPRPANLGASTKRLGWRGLFRSLRVFQDPEEALRAALVGRHERRKKNGNAEEVAP